ncbi:hypothetical protein [Flavobacterium sp.]|uniref:hypothetical protein n=1 Tax=Flavobacterium sp. TaxID=239 RepID=UPI0025C1F41E|nr:hypothetical protein [Flavobacterium sp.]MBA4155093.1 hypothetical protein [Flavobacterium sp.]
MTKRDFFRILIKIFGLYSIIISTFLFLPQVVNQIFYFNDISAALITIGSLLVCFVLLLLLLFKTDFIIDKLELDKGFDDQMIILGDFNSISILKFAILLIAGFLIIDNISEFLYHLINSFKKEVSLYGIGKQEVDYFNLSVSFLNIVLGYLLISNYKKIAQYLDK